MADLFSHPSEAADVFDQSGWLTISGNTRKASILSVAAPHFGRFRISVKAEGTQALFGQRRNLVGTDIKSESTSFFTCLTEYIPSMQNRANKSLALFASAFGGELSDMHADECDVRTVFIAGDSTVADQYAVPYYPSDSYCGWGQMLSAFLSENAVCNMAHSGLTSRCFIEDGHFDIVLRHMQPNDLCLVQFGHNDQKRRCLQADQQYKTYLKKICGQVLQKNAVPVLVSPISRVPGKDEAGYFDLLEEHANAVKSLACDMSLPFIDLHSFSFDLFCRMGAECRSLFRDMTHSNDPGAFCMAKYIAGELDKLGLAVFAGPEAGFISSDKARAPSSDGKGPLPVSYLDIGDVADKSAVYDGVQKGLLDPCVLHMHPFDPVTRAAFMQLLFRAAHIPSETTNGRSPFPDIKPREFDASFAAAAKKLGLVTEDRYRPDDLITAEEANVLFRRAKLPVRIPVKQSYPCKLEIVQALLSIM